jgi:hypothetical protein
MYDTYMHTHIYIYDNVYTNIIMRYQVYHIISFNLRNL